MSQEPPLYQIVDWNAHFENNKSRERGRCKFVCLPNHHGGVGLRNVLGELDGIAIYGAWCLIVQLCSRQEKPRKGFLTVDGKAEGRRLSGEDLARLWGLKVEQIYRVFQVTSRTDVGWIRLVKGEHEWQKEAQMPAECPPGAREVPAECPPTQTLGNQDGISARRVPAECPSGALERKKEEDCTLNITYHNITVRRGELDNKRKTEEEVPWINALFENFEPWSYEELRLLSELLPIRPESKRLLIWAHNVPPDNPFRERVKLKMSRLSLLREYGSEVDKIKSGRRSMGLNGELAPERIANG